MVQPETKSEEQFERSNLAARDMTAQEIANQNVAASRSEEPNAIFDLPEEVKKNVIGYPRMELAERIRLIVCAHTSPVNVDRITVLLYTRYQAVAERPLILSVLRELSQQGDIVAVKGVRGQYLAPAAA